MSAINPDAQRALTEKRGKELDMWIVMRFIRLMSGIEPFSLTLSDLPTEIMHHVVEKMEPVDKLRARKVCRCVRTAVDTIGTCFDEVKLWFIGSKINLISDGIKTSYTTAANVSTNAHHSGQEKLIDGENFVKEAVKDLKIVAKHARKIEIWNNTEDNGIVTTFMEFLKSEKCMLVEEIKLNKFSFDEVLTILLCFDANGLKKIELIGITLIYQFERITHLEQWVNAEEFGLIFSKIASTMTVHLFNFKCLRIHKLDTFSVQTAIQIRDDLLRRSTFQECSIRFGKSKINPIKIARVFKPNYARGNEFKIQYSNGNDRFDISLRKFDSDNFQLNVTRL